MFDLIRWLVGEVDDGTHNNIPPAASKADAVQRCDTIMGSEVEDQMGGRF